MIYPEKSLTKIDEKVRTFFRARDKRIAFKPLDRLPHEALADAAKAAKRLAAEEAKAKAQSQQEEKKKD